jgi:hypothetical protein
MTKPDAKRLIEQSRFVYDTQTGQIVHSYHIGASAQSPMPSEQEIDAQAIEEAARLTNRPAAGLASLSFDRNSIKPGIHYSVQVGERRLVEVENTIGTASAGTLRD